MLDAWLDLVHGATCVGCAAPGRSLCHGCRAELPTSARRVWPSPCPEGLAPCLAAGEYAGLLGALVVAHKEHAAFALAAPLGGALALAVAAAAPSGRPTVLVPVPSRPRVVRARGHDPMLRVSRVAAGRLIRAGRSARVLPLLRQSRSVADQAGLDSAARRANLGGSMCTHPALAHVIARLESTAAGPVTVVVCDDVLTTGHTAREAQRALEDAGVRVGAVATVAATRKHHPPPAGPLSLS